MGRTLNGNDVKMLGRPSQAVGVWPFFRNVVLGALSKGRVYPENWKSKPRKNLFCRVKGGCSSSDLDQIQGQANIISKGPEVTVQRRVWTFLFNCDKGSYCLSSMVLDSGHWARCSLYIITVIVTAFQSKSLSSYCSKR